MQVIECEQRTEQWYQARLGKVTASRFSDVLAKGQGKTRESYLRQLAAERLTGIPTETYTNEYMENGINLEDEARQAYIEHTGNTVEQVGFCVHDEWVGVSPDGFVNDDGLIEIKCPKTTTHLGYIWGDSLPKSYYSQIQGQLWVTDRSWCDFVSYDGRVASYPLFIKRIERYETFISELQSEICKFIIDLQTKIRLINPLY